MVGVELFYLMLIPLHCPYIMFLFLPFFHSVSFQWIIDTAKDSFDQNVQSVCILKINKKSNNNQSKEEEEEVEKREENINPAQCSATFMLCAMFRQK